MQQYTNPAKEKMVVGLNIFPYKHPTEVKQNYGYKSKILLICKERTSGYTIASKSIYKITY
jgi:hypothetical protein